jgi:AraC family transcriptional regulator of adaptative response / DNA-3-methyladenine glycosylase II
LSELVGDGAHGDARTFAERFVALPGIGPWTASYVAMRALRDADAFPEGDLALRKAAGGITAAALRARAEAWRPWRAYAAQHLWASLG